jgi:hypothetical protein
VANLVNLLAPQAELPRPPARIADRQNRQRMPPAGGTDRAAPAVAHGALQQRTAHDLPGHRELVDQFLAGGMDIGASFHLER